ncbi:MAG TPA: hypothetical protein VHJ78_05220 [Actinomycetota bacterium]|nr:hypothetical protein [Actinomycetota bacterium]
MEYRPEQPPAETGPILGAVALGLALGLLWELLMVQSNWRLGFRPPVWEVVVGWLGFSAFISFVLSVFAFAAGAIYSTNVVARNPESWDARESMFRVRRRVAAFVIGSGGLAAFGGVVMWGASRMGPEFDTYRGFARFTAFMGAAAAVGAYMYLKRALDSPA